MQVCFKPGLCGAGGKVAAVMRCIGEVAGRRRVDRAVRGCSTSCMVQSISRRDTQAARVEDCVLLVDTPLSAGGQECRHSSSDTRASESCGADANRGNRCPVSGQAAARQGDVRNVSCAVRPEEARGGLG